MANDRVISTLETALSATPDDVELRLHIADTYLGMGNGEPALSHFTTILASDPANLSAIQGAADAANLTGDKEKSLAYSTLFTALSGAANAAEHNDQSSAATPVQSTPEKIALAKSTPSDATNSASEVKGSQSWQPKIITGATSDDNVVEFTKKPKPPSLTLDDVAGLEEVKHRLNTAFLQPIRNPELANRYGKKVSGGLLLYGPPGCGKTYIARALAGELNANFISIGLEDILSMWVGESEHQLHAMFENARQQAPTLIFFDELDALGRKRSDLGSSSTREIVNQLLTELDGIGGTDEPVYVLGATNLPWDVDDALKRPGRFDRTVFVSPPDEIARAKIIEMNLEKKPTDSINIKDIVKRTRGFSGADVNYVCEIATEAAMEEAMTTGNELPINKKHFSHAIKESQSSIRTWFENARNYTKFANASGQYNQLAEYINAHKP